MKKAIFGINDGQWSTGVVLTAIVGVSAAAEYTIGHRFGTVFVIGSILVGVLAAMAIVIDRGRSIPFRWGAGSVVVSTLFLTSFRGVDTILADSQAETVAIASVVALTIGVTAALAYRFGGLVPSALAPITLWAILAYPLAREPYVSFGDEPTTTWVVIWTGVLAVVIGGSLVLVGYTLGVAARLEFGTPSDSMPWAAATGLGTLSLVPITVVAVVLLPLPIALVLFGLPLCGGALVLWV